MAEGGKAEPQIISNYRNTGCTALIWDLGDFSVKNTSSDVAGAHNGARTLDNKDWILGYNMKILESAVKGRYTNHNYAYFYADNLSDSFKFTPPTNTYKHYDNSNIHWEFYQKGYWNYTEYKPVKDTRNLFGHGTDVTILQAYAPFSYTPPMTLLAQKQVKGDTDATYVTYPNAGLTSRTNGTAEYRLIVHNNNRTMTYDKVTVLDILPRKEGDKQVSLTTQNGVTSRKDRGSTMDVYLNGPVSVPSGYTVHYTTINPSTYGDNMAGFTTANIWRTWAQVSSQPEAVTAFKITMNSGTSLAPQNRVEITVPVKTPNASGAVFQHGTARHSVPFGTTSTLSSILNALGVTGYNVADVTAVSFSEASKLTAVKSGNDWQITLQSYLGNRFMTITMQDGRTLTLSVPDNMQGVQAVNSFGVAADYNYNYAESNEVLLRTLAYNVNGVAFLDTDGNSLYDAGVDQVYANRTVRLVNTANNQVVAETVTDADGHYSIDYFVDGTYQVLIGLPEPYDRLGVVAYSADPLGSHTRSVAGGYAVTEPFTSDRDYPVEIRNAGFYKNQVDFTVRKTVPSFGVDQTGTYNSAASAGSYKLMARPDANSNVVAANLTTSESITILGKYGLYYLAENAAGTRGWIPMAAVKTDLEAQHFFQITVTLQDATGTSVNFPSGTGYTASGNRASLYLTNGGSLTFTDVPVSANGGTFVTVREPSHDGYFISFRVNEDAWSHEEEVVLKPSVLVSAPTVTVRNTSSSGFEIRKVDQATGDLITSDSAIFVIRNLDGKYYTSAGGWVNSKTDNAVLKLDTEDTGTVALPGALPAGIYTLEEIKVPAGYTAGEPVKITKTSSQLFLGSVDYEPAGVRSFKSHSDLTAADKRNPYQWNYGNFDRDIGAYAEWDNIESGTLKITYSICYQQPGFIRSVLPDYITVQDVNIYYAAGDYYTYDQQAMQNLEGNRQPMPTADWAMDGNTLYVGFYPPSSGWPSGEVSAQAVVTATADWSGDEYKNVIGDTSACTFGSTGWHGSASLDPVRDWGTMSGRGSLWPWSGDNRPKLARLGSKVPYDPDVGIRVNNVSQPQELTVVKSVAGADTAAQTVSVTQAEYLHSEPNNAVGTRLVQVPNGSSVVVLATVINQYGNRFYLVEYNGNRGWYRHDWLSTVSGFDFFQITVRATNKSGEKVALDAGVGYTVENGEAILYLANGGNITMKVPRGVSVRLAESVSSYDYVTSHEIGNSGQVNGAVASIDGMDNSATVTFYNSPRSKSSLTVEKTVVDESPQQLRVNGSNALVVRNLPSDSYTTVKTFSTAQVSAGVYLTPLAKVEGYYFVRYEDAQGIIDGWIWDGRLTAAENVRFFPVELTMKDENGDQVKPNEGTGYTVSGNVATMYLANGGYLTVPNILRGYEVSVQETNTYGYHVRYENSNLTNGTTENGVYTATLDGVDGTVTVINGLQQLTVRKTVTDAVAAAQTAKLANAANLYPTPSASGTPVAANIAADTSVTLLAKNSAGTPSWYLVSCSGGTGWVLASSVKDIPADMKFFPIEISVVDSANAAIALTGKSIPGASIGTGADSNKATAWLANGGSFVIPDLPEGAKVTVKETDATGYTVTYADTGLTGGATANEAYTATVGTADGTVTVTNTPNSPITIKKVDATGNLITTGATFKVRCDFGENQGKWLEVNQTTGQIEWKSGNPEQVGTPYTTGTDGTVELPALPAGDYTLKEVAPPDGYRPIAGNDETAFTVNANGKVGGATTVTWPTYTPGERIYVKGGEAGNAIINIAGVQIEGQERYGEECAESNDTFTATWVDDLPGGKLHIRLSDSETWGDRDSPFIMFLMADGVSIDPASVQLSGTVSDPDGVPGLSAGDPVSKLTTWSLEDVDLGDGKYHQALIAYLDYSGGYSNYGPEYTRIFDFDVVLEDGLVLDPADWTEAFTLLARDDYRDPVEHDPWPQAYRTPAAAYDAYVNGTRTGSGGMRDTIVSRITLSLKPAAVSGPTIEVVNTPAQPPVIWKIDATGKQPITTADAKFVLQNTEGKYWNTQTSTWDAVTGTPGEAYEIISDAEGKLTLPVGLNGSYTLTETAAPAGYTLPDAASRSHTLVINNGVLETLDGKGANYDSGGGGASGSSGTSTGGGSGTSTSGGTVDYDPTLLELPGSVPLSADKDGLPKAVAIQDLTDEMMRGAVQCNAGLRSTTAFNPFTIEDTAVAVEWVNIEEGTFRLYYFGPQGGYWTDYGVRLVFPAYVTIDSVKHVFTETAKDGTTDERWVADETGSLAGRAYTFHAYPSGWRLSGSRRYYDYDESAVTVSTCFEGHVDVNHPDWSSTGWNDMLVTDENSGLVASGQTLAQLSVEDLMSITGYVHGEGDMYKKIHALTEAEREFIEENDLFPKGYVIVSANGTDFSANDPVADYRQLVAWLKNNAQNASSKQLYITNYTSASIDYNPNAAVKLARLLTASTNDSFAIYNTKEAPPADVTVKKTVADAKPADQQGKVTAATLLREKPESAANGVANGSVAVNDSLTLLRRYVDGNNATWYYAQSGTAEGWILGSCVDAGATRFFKLEATVTNGSGSPIDLAGKAIPGATIGTGANSNKVTAELANGGSFVIPALPEGAQVDVRELNPDGYTVQINKTGGAPLVLTDNLENYYSPEYKDSMGSLSYTNYNLDFVRSTASLTDADMYDRNQMNHSSFVTQDWMDVTTDGVRARWINIDSGLLEITAICSAAEGETFSVGSRLVFAEGVELLPETLEVGDMLAGYDYNGFFTGYYVEPNSQYRAAVDATGDHAGKALTALYIRSENQTAAVRIQARISGFTEGWKDLIVSDDTPWRTITEYPPIYNRSLPSAYSYRLMYWAPGVPDTLLDTSSYAIEGTDASSPWGTSWVNEATNSTDEGLRDVYLRMTQQDQGYEGPQGSVMLYRSPKLARLRGGASTIEVVNTPVPKIIVHKTDLEGNDLKDAVFAVRCDFGENQGRWLYEDPTTGQLQWKNGQPDVVGTPYRTGADGKVTLPGLAPGDYTLKEIDPPGGYRPVGGVDETAFKVNDNGKVAGASGMETRVVPVNEKGLSFQPIGMMAAYEYGDIEQVAAGFINRSPVLLQDAVSNAGYNQAYFQALKATGNAFGVEDIEAAFYEYVFCVKPTAQPDVYHLDLFLAVDDYGEMPAALVRLADGVELVDGTASYDGFIHYAQWGQRLGALLQDVRDIRDYSQLEPDVAAGNDALFWYFSMKSTYDSTDPNDYLEAAHQYFCHIEADLRLSASFAPNGTDWTDLFSFYATPNGFDNATYSWDRYEGAENAQTASGFYQAYLDGTVFGTAYNPRQVLRVVDYQLRGGGSTETDTVTIENEPDDFSLTVVKSVLGEGPAKQAGTVKAGGATLYEAPAVTAQQAATAAEGAALTLLRKHNDGTADWYQATDGTATGWVPAAQVETDANFFPFEVTVMEEDGATAATLDAIPGATVEGNKVTFWLANNGSITLTHLPKNSKATIKETSHDGYQVLIKEGNANLANGNTSPVLTMNQPKTITVVNNPGIELPQTGGPGTHFWSYGGLALMALAVGMIVVPRRRRTGKEVND